MALARARAPVPVFVARARARVFVGLAWLANAVRSRAGGRSFGGLKHHDEPLQSSRQKSQKQKLRESSIALQTTQKSKQNQKQPQKT
jgi:hypothetical protein